MKFETKIPIFSITPGAFFALWKKSTGGDRKNQYFCLKFHIWALDGKMQHEKKLRLILRTFGRLDHHRGGTVQANACPKWHIFLTMSIVRFFWASVLCICYCYFWLMYIVWLFCLLN
jgi:hypothetical protein